MSIDWPDDWYHAAALGAVRAAGCLRAEIAGRAFWLCAHGEGVTAVTDPCVACGAGAEADAFSGARWTCPACGAAIDLDAAVEAEPGEAPAALAPAMVVDDEVYVSVQDGSGR